MSFSVTLLPLANAAGKVFGRVLSRPGSN